MPNQNSDNVSEKPPKMPYLGTKISADLTQIQIFKLLRLYGIEEKRWTDQGENTLLEFSHVLGNGKTITFAFKLPILMIERRIWDESKGYVKKLVRHRGAEMRLLFWYLNAKLQAIEWGLESFEMEMATHAVVRQAGGSTTFGEVIRPHFEQGQLPEVKALPVREPVRDRIIDVTPEAQ